MSDYWNTDNTWANSVHMGDNVTATHNRTEIRHEEYFDHRTTIGMQQNVYRTDPNAITYDAAKEACTKHGSRTRAVTPTGSQNDVIRRVVSGTERNIESGVLSVLWPWKSDREWPTASAFIRAIMESKVLSGYYPIILRSKASDTLTKIKREWFQGLGDFEEYRFFLSNEFMKMNRFVLVFHNESPNALAELHKEMSVKKEVKDMKIISTYQMSQGSRPPWVRRDFDLEPSTAAQADDILAYVKERSFRTEPGEHSLAALRIYYEEKNKRLAERESRGVGTHPGTQTTITKSGIFGIEKSVDSPKRIDGKGSETGPSPVLLLTENPKYFERNLYEVTRFAFSGMSWGRKLLVVSMAVFVPYLVYLFLGTSVLFELFLSLFGTIGTYTLLRYLWVNYIPKE